MEHHCYNVSKSLQLPILWKLQADHRLPVSVLDASAGMSDGEAVSLASGVPPPCLAPHQVTLARIK
jgi:hypothetical protein